MRERALSWAVVAAGLAVLGLTAVLSAMPLASAAPLDGDYGDQPMIAFELADSPRALARVIGADARAPAVATLRARFDRANRVDFAYAAAYGAFVALSCVQLARRRRRRFVWLGAALGVVAALCDVAENRALLALTAPDADTTALLAALHLRTMCKWEALAAASALFYAGFIDGGKWPSALAAALALAAVAAGVLTAVDGARWIQWLTMLIGATWVWQLAYATWALRSRRAIAR